MDSENRNCQNCKQAFTIESEDFSFYKKIGVPAPTFCSECRLQRRLSFRNERSLYKRKCDLCAEGMISMYSPEKPFKVYCPSCFNSDKWDPTEYGRDYDFSKSFFVQWKELQLAIPHISLIQYNTVNSPWVNYEADVKNCYLDFGGHNNEDSAYNQYALKCRDCFDNFWPVNGQFVYESIFTGNAYKNFYSTLCFDCRDTYFSFDCRDCSNVIGCTGLRHKQNYIFNKPVSKEEFQTFLKENVFGSHQRMLALEKKAKDFVATQPQRATFIDKSVDVSGNLITESKNCKWCWNVEKTEDAKYAFYTRQLKDAQDTTSAWWGELFYEVIAGGGQVSNARFSFGALEGSTNIEYSYLLFGCHNCFGSMHMRKKEYCILNKEYLKEEYEALRTKIIAHMNEMPYVSKTLPPEADPPPEENPTPHTLHPIYRYGEFFPHELSPFAYNETVAYEYFPLKKEEAISQGLSWHEPNSASPVSFSDYTIPDDIKDVKDDILEKVLKCEVSGKAYRLIPMELQFYRRFGLPIPRISPFERHRARLAFIRDHRTLQSRMCGKCNKEIMTVYSQNEFSTIYCNECYAREVA